MTARIASPPTGMAPFFLRSSMRYFSQSLVILSLVGLVRRSRAFVQSMPTRVRLLIDQHNRMQNAFKLQSVDQLAELAMPVHTSQRGEMAWMA